MKSRKEINFLIMCLNIKGQEMDIIMRNKCNKHIIRSQMKEYYSSYNCTAVRRNFTIT